MQLGLSDENSSGNIIGHWPTKTRYVDELDTGKNIDDTSASSPRCTPDRPISPVCGPCTASASQRQENRLNVEKTVGLHNLYAGVEILLDSLSGANKLRQSARREDGIRGGNTHVDEAPYP